MERLSAEESDAYFQTRPPERRVGAWASPQSRPMRHAKSSTSGSARSRSASPARRSRGPSTGAGSVLRPLEIEFWQGQVGRLHDRFLYTREDEGWTIQRLGP